MKKMVFILLLMFGVTTVIAMDGSHKDEPQQQIIVVNEKPLEEGLSIGEWILILTGCITPIAIAFITRKK